jgi:hypothetical protein
VFALALLLLHSVAVYQAILQSADFWHFQENVPRLHTLFSTYFLVLTDDKRQKGMPLLPLNRCHAHRPSLVSSVPQLRILCKGLLMLVIKQPPG